MICDKCGWNDNGTGDAHQCMKRSDGSATSVQIAAWLASDEGRAAIADSMQKSRDAIDALNKDREIPLESLNTPMTDFSRHHIQTPRVVEPTTCPRCGKRTAPDLIHTCTPTRKK